MFTLPFQQVFGLPHIIIAPNDVIGDSSNGVKIREIEK